MPAPETFLPNLLGTWRADTLSGADMVDLSGNGRTLFSTGMVYGVTHNVDGWGVAGRAVALPNGSTNYLTAASAAPWAPLNDGTGFSMWCVLRATHSGQKVVFDTGAFDPAVNGAYVWIDGDEQRVGLDFTKNVLAPNVTPNQGRIIDYVLGARFSWKGTFEMGVPHVLIVTVTTATLPNINLWLDGHLIDGLSIGDREKGPSTILIPPLGPEQPRHFNAGPPGFPLRAFCQANNVLDLLQAEVGEIGFTSSPLTDPDREGVEDWAASHYGVSLSRTTPTTGLIGWDGDSLMDPFWNPPLQNYPEFVTPLLTRPQRNFMRAIAGLETNQMTSRRPKHVVPMYDPSLPFSIIVASEMVNELADGATKEDAFANFMAYCLATQAEGWQVVVETMEPNKDAGGPAEAGVPGPIGRANFEYLRDRLRAEWHTFANALADTASDPIMGSWDMMVSDWGGGAGPRTYWVDGVHRTPLGNQLVVPYFVDAINALLVIVLNDIPSQGPTMPAGMITFGRTGEFLLTGIGGNHADGRYLRLAVASASTILRISNQDARSLPQNRIQTSFGGPDPYTVDGGVTLVYDGPSQFWRLVETFAP